MSGVSRETVHEKFQAFLQEIYDNPDFRKKKDGSKINFTTFRGNVHDAFRMIETVIYELDTANGAVLKAMHEGYFGGGNLKSIREKVVRLVRERKRIPMRAKREGIRVDQKHRGAIITDPAAAEARPRAS